MIKTLEAWEPYRISLLAFYFLHNLESPGDHKHREIYWVAAITSARAVYHVLVEQDLKGSELKRKINNSYKARASESLVLQSFVRDQRDRTIKRWIFDLEPMPVMVGKPRGTPFKETHKDLVFKYPNPERAEHDVDEKLQGEDAIRLLGIALDELHMNLAVVEIALAESIERPFEGTRPHSLYNLSEFLDDGPRYYR